MPRALLRLTLLSLILLMTYSLLKTCSAPATSPYAGSAQFADGKFRNPVRLQDMGLGKTLAVLWRFMFDKPADASPAKPIPVQALSRAELLAAPEGSLYRLGHSTLLLKLAGEFWLTDPVFAERASPLSFLGPKRFHAPPISLDELPPIKAVILSHDHYDHLDHDAVLALAAKTELFLTPLGVGDTLVGWGIPAAQVRQLDWWQETRVGALRFVATPAQHFSGRGLRDGNRNLWASWVIIGEQQRVFFSGDSGYFAGFKTIGERFGPFDLTLIETGAYNQDWADVHMQPEQSLQAHLDLRGRHLLPVHNGTFDLALHPWQEPFERIVALAAAQGVALTTPRMGERIAIGAPPPAQTWWRD